MQPFLTFIPLICFYLLTEIIMRKIHLLYPLVFTVLVILPFSCATIMNQPEQKIYISKDHNIKDVSVAKSLSVDSSFLGEHAPKAYWVSRSPEPITVELHSAGTKEKVALQAKNSFEYWANIFTNYGIGMLVDKDTKKRYSYPVRNYFFLDNGKISRKRFAPLKKGTLQLMLGTTFPNNFLLESDHGKYHSFGPPGIAAGIDYFYKEDQYLSVNFGAATDIFGEHFGPGYLEKGYVLYTSVRNNTVKGSFDIGYGLNLTRSGWARMTFGDTTNRDNSIKSTGLGLSLSTQYRMGGYFRIGLLYQPDFIVLNRNFTFNYQHFASVNFIWKLSLKSPLRK